MKEGAATVLVTGGAGFIGTATCERLLERGYKVRCFDNFSSSSESSIKHLSVRSNFHFVYGDIRSEEDCRNAFAGITHVIHLAALVSVPLAMKNPGLAHSINVEGFRNILRWVEKSNLKRVVYASSCAVYGNSTLMPLQEDTVLNPLSDYAISKFQNEKDATQCSTNNSIETIGLRYFNVFGTRQNPDGAYAAVIPKFITNLFQGIRPLIYGDGNQIRDFISVENVAMINVLSLELGDIENRAELINVATGEGISIIKLLDLIKEVSSKFDVNVNSIAPQFQEPREGDIRVSIGSTKKLFSYYPELQEDMMRENLLKIVKWFFDQREHK